MAVQIAASPALDHRDNFEALRETPRDPQPRPFAIFSQSVLLRPSAFTGPSSPSSNFVSMLSLLVLLAPVGAETCNLKRSGQNGPLFSVLNVNPTVHPFRT